MRHDTAKGPSVETWPPTAEVRGESARVGTGSAMSLVAWAFDLANQKLCEAVPRRWAHVQGVARQARTLQAVAGPDADLLEAAAVLHDVGYPPDLATTKFHPLDGARFLQDEGAPARLVNLVAHHSYAVLEARMRAPGTATFV